MDEALQFVVEMHECIWNGFKASLSDATDEEVNWRPVPQANTMNLILRHLRIEAQEHLWRIEHAGHSAPPPAASLPLDFQQNLKELEELFAGFTAALRKSTLAELQQKTAQGYPESPPGRSRPPHFLAFHQVLHLAMHWGQMNTLRNLYRKSRGEPVRFFPVNPNFPT